MLKRTPLFAAHQKLGARLVEFGGWEMPVQYTSIVEEHLAVRNAAGIFDISHMGLVSVSGPAAADFLNATLTNDIRKLAHGQGQYTLMCNERGGVIDDLYAYHLDFFDPPDRAPVSPESAFMLIINASRREADMAWLAERLLALPEPAGVHFRYSSEVPRGTKLKPGAYRHAGVDLCGCLEVAAAVAVQGPKVRGFIDQLFTGPARGGVRVARPSELKKNQIALFGFGDEFAWVARTGYTGEDGFEVIEGVAHIERIWNACVAAGAKPCGLGARDTLRTEVCYPLYGHELDENTTPIEAGLAFFVALDKGDFVGRAALAEQKARGTAMKCVAFKMTDKSPPPRPQCPIWGPGAGVAQIGEVTSGTHSPSLGLGIGLGYVPPEFARPGTPIEIEIRGRRYGAAVVPKPIYRKPV